jgi:hypothetical protein
MFILYGVEFLHGDSNVPQSHIELVKIFVGDIVQEEIMLCRAYL